MKVRGYSLLEILAVLLVLSVLAGFVMNRSREDAFRLEAEAEILKSHLRYVRHLALVNDVNAWEIRFQPDRYALYRNGGSAGLALPNENEAFHRFPPGMEIAVSAIGSQGTVGAIRWDKWGRPAELGDVVVTLSDAVNGGTVRFQINQETGLIQ
jgi:prepilin-type N-terminal cleavage/methylation domain-containing protein